MQVSIPPETVSMHDLDEDAEALLLRHLDKQGRDQEALALEEHQLIHAALNIIVAKKRH